MRIGPPEGIKCHEQANSKGQVVIVLATLPSRASDLRPIKTLGLPRLSRRQCQRLAGAGTGMPFDRRMAIG